MHPSTALLRRVAVGVAAAGCFAIPLSDFHWYSIPDPSVETVGSYSARFEGVAMDGLDLVWTGAVGGVINGDMSMRVEQLGAPIDAASATWRVHVITFVAADDPARSFAADLAGTIDWSTHTIALSGEVTDGYLVGTRITQRGLIKEDYNTVGSLQIAPALLVRR